MDPNYIALAVPFFFLLIGIELLMAARRGVRAYRFGDALADIGCGITQRIVLLFCEGALLFIYTAAYQHRLADLGRRPLVAWSVAFVAVDFLYYWWHRASHRSNALWAAHVVHHQSEDYNLAVALRQGILTPWTAAPFALPLALVGIPPLVYAACAALNTLYQFGIHTELVGRLGPLERVLNTPSHHRVHHARNPRYLDRNYAAVFIVWDRLFGTFAPEAEPPRYGITKPLRSFNPLWAQLEPLVALAKLAGGAPGWRARIGVWLAPPERAFAWAPSTFTPEEKYDVPVTGGRRRYVLVNLALATLATFWLMLRGASLPGRWLVAGGALVLTTVAGQAGVVEKRSWARPFEIARWIGVAALLAALI